MMRKLVVMISAAVLSVFFAAPCLAQDAVRVKMVLDGDTFVLESGETVRLAGIDAPELGRDGEPDRYFAREAAAALGLMVKGQDLRLEFGKQKTDRYGRLLAFAYLPDGRMVNLDLVKNGFAFCYPHDDNVQGFPWQCVTVQREAMAAQRGFWPIIFKHPLVDKAWLGNRASMRFHHPQCPQAGKIRAYNRIVFDSLVEAFAAGLAPARDCFDWPVVEPKQ